MSCTGDATTALLTGELIVIAAFKFNPARKHTAAKAILVDGIMNSLSPDRYRYSQVYDSRVIHITEGRPRVLAQEIPG